jgi:mono/diheme cytochrome c family protein
MITKGRSVFSGRGTCFACHGADGRGAVGPSLADSAWLHSDGDYAGIVSTITAGVSARASKSGVVMPARGGSAINDEELRAVAAYVWSLRFQQRTARRRRAHHHGL